MGKRSWVCTLITQISLCFALFIALNIGRPQRNPLFEARSNLYFVSVRGGFRPFKQQTQLLRQLEKAINAYNVKFVIDYSELGDEDPLLLNATNYLQSLQVPWYTATASKREGANYFLKRVVILHENMLDLIALDTGSLQDSTSGAANDQLHWLTRTLETSNSSWRIVVGLHPMVACNGNIEQMEINQTFVPLHNIFLRYGVDAYLSGQACAIRVHNKNAKQLKNAGPVDKGHYLTSLNQRLVFPVVIVNGFLLHRVNSLEIVTYSISLTGEVVYKISIKRQGNEVM
ncbi:Acid phosphatase [Bertholletia excelsa]